MIRAALVILLALLAGALIGAFTALLTRVVYVPILVPLFMGAAIGSAVGFWSNASEFFGGPVPWIATLLSCLVCLLVFHYTEYADGFTNLVRRAHEVEDPALGVVHLTDEQVREMADRTLVSAVGQGGFVGFLRLRARAGMRLRGFGPGLLGTRFALVVWVLDVLVLILLAFRVAVGAAGRGRR